MNASETPSAAAMQLQSSAGLAAEAAQMDPSSLSALLSDPNKAQQVVQLSLLSCVMDHKLSDICCP